MLKGEAENWAHNAEGEVILAEIERASLDQEYTDLMARRMANLERVRQSTRDLLLARQIVESFSRGGRHAMNIEDFRMNLRIYVNIRGPVEYMEVDFMRGPGWIDMDEEERARFLTGVREIESRKEQEILAGYRGPDGEYFEEHAHMKWDNPHDAQQEAIRAQEKEELTRRAQAERERAAQLAREQEREELEAANRVEWRIGPSGSKVPYRNGKRLSRRQIAAEGIKPPTRSGR